MKFRGPLILLFTVILISGYYLFQESKSGNVAIDEIIPQTASLVFQIDSPKDQLAALKNLNWFQPLDNVPLISSIDLSLNILDSLEVSQVIKSKLSNLSMWVSLHKTSSDKLTPLYIIQSEGFDWDISNVESILDLSLQDNVSASVQNYNGREITLFELDMFSLSALVEGDYLAISESTVLVEDVVRAIQNPESRLLTEELEPNKSANIRLMVNGARLRELGQVFFESPDFFVLRENNEENLLLEIGVNDEGLSFNGSGDIDASNPETLGSLIFAENFIPEVATSFVWQPFKGSNSAVNAFLGEGVCTIDIARNGTSISKVHLFSSQDTTALSNYLKVQATENLQPVDSAVYRERFVNSDISFINNTGFLNTVLSAEPDQFGAPFYTIIQDVLIMSDDVDALKTVLNDFDAETTWGRLVNKRPVIKDLIQQTNLTVLQDFDYARDPFIKKLKPSWLSFFNDRPQLLDVLGLFTLQVNHTQKELLVSGGMSFNSGIPQPTSPTKGLNELTVKANVFSESELNTKPYIVRNHVDASLEVAFQAVDNTFHLADRQGEVLWKKKLPSPIMGEVHQVDYYNNKKLQYLLFSDSLIHLIDRNGHDVDGFPKPYASNLPIDGSRIIDYDNNKRYRYLAKDRRGRLYLFGKDGDPLEGWMPKEIGGALLQTPFHVRVRGRDCFVVVESTGKVHLLNRRGEEYQGFPVNIDKSLAGDVSFTRGSNFGQSLISLSTVDGELIQLNMNGELLLRKQLLRNSGRSEFSLVDDELESTFSIVRNDGSTLTFFDAEGNERFAKYYPNSRSVIINQYNFRNGKEVFALTDESRKVVRLIDRDGNFLTPEIANSQPISILFYQNRLEYEVFVNFANQMNVYVVKPL